jgi:mandelamide amidase
MDEKKLGAQSSCVEILEAFRCTASTLTGYLLETEPAREKAKELNAFIVQGSSVEPLSTGGVLQGLPISVKDNISVEGFATTGATPVFKDLLLNENPVISRLRQEGVVVVGKTNLHELAFGITGTNDHTGAALNPFDPSRLAGGSSSGAAISVAVGAVATAIGTDTGGSCRIPAAHCGVVGFRPTTGRYPQGEDDYIALSSSRDTLGIITRSVADVALIDAVITQGRVTTPTREVGEVVLGAVDPRSFGFEGDPDVIRAYDEALERLKKQGVTLVSVSLEKAIAADEACGFQIAVYESAKSVEYLVQKMIDMPFATFVKTIASPDVQELFASQCGPEAMPETVYQEAIKQLPLLKRAFADVFSENKVDALIYPTSLYLAPPVSIGEIFEAGGIELPTFPAYTATTRPDSMAGQPSISLPYGTVKGMPVGLQLVGPCGQDVKLLDVAMAIESVLPPRPIPVFND